MNEIKKRRNLLENMIRIEERDMESAKSENRQARQALNQMERYVAAAQKSVSEIEHLIRGAFNSNSILSLDELQSRRIYLAHQRTQLVEHLVRKSHAEKMVERIGARLAEKQKKINKLREMLGDVAKRMRQSEEKIIHKENDEQWIQSQGRK